MKSEGKIFYKVITLLLAVVLITSSCGQKEVEEASEPKLPAVQVIKPEFKVYRTELTLSGVTDSPGAVQTSFLVSGKIQKMNFEEGDVVKKGQVLARIDPDMYEKQVENAKSRVNLAVANLKNLEAGARPEDKSMAKSAMLQAKTQLEQARRDFERYKNVYREDAISRQQFEQARDRYQLAKQQYESAKQQYKKVISGATVENINVYRANVRVAQKAVEQAQLQLTYTVLHSPIDGVISRKLAEEGVVVNAGTPIYEIREINSMDLVINVPSVHIDEISIGKQAEVYFSGNKDEKIKATVRQIQPVSDPSTRSYQVKLKMAESPHKKWYSGTIGKAVFEIDRGVKGAFIPLSSLMKDQEENFYVYTVDKNNKVNKVKVKVGKVKDQQAMIQADLKDSDRIVISGQEYINDGDKVRIVDALNAQKFVSPNREVDNEQINQEL